MAGKRTSEKDKIIAKIEAEISLREMTGQDQFVPGLEAAIAVVDAGYYTSTYLKAAK